MKVFSLILLQSWILIFSFGASAQTTKPVASPPNAEQIVTSAKLPEVRDELLKRAKAARELRLELVKNNSVDGVARLVKNDQDNTLWVKTTIEKYGWLGYSLVGADGEEAAFKLAMYAILYPVFQKQYFEFLQQAVRDGEAPTAQPSLLAERMKLAAGNITTPLPPGAVIKSTNGASAQIITSQTPSDVKYPELREELLKRMASDQRVRVEPAEKYKGVPTPKEVLDEMLKIDADNTACIKPLIKQHGWLGNSLVGTNGAAAVFLIVQHTQDAELRRSSLELLRRAYKKGEACGDHLALLTDRVLMFEGKPQIYGTQTKTTKEGKLEVWTIEDEDNVDQRRAEVGLGPLAEYIKRLRKMYEKPKS